MYVYASIVNKRGTYKGEALITKPYPGHVNLEVELRKLTHAHVYCNQPSTNFVYNLIGLRGGEMGIQKKRC